MFNSKTYGLGGVLAVAAFCPVAIKATPPPPPPPPAESVEIAKGFWSDRAKLRWSLEVATKDSIHDTVSYMLDRKSISRDTKKGQEKYKLLRDFFWRNILPVVDDRLDSYLSCRASYYGFMPIDQLYRIREFLQSSAGEKFFESSGGFYSDAYGCGKLATLADRSRLMPEAWKVIGVKRPPLPPPPQP
jgi:hypothetical protein